MKPGITSQSDQKRTVSLENGTKFGSTLIKNKAEVIPKPLMGVCSLR